MNADTLAAPHADARWVDRTAYPFRSHYLTLDAGRMHYLDEGEGQPLVFVHGTPTWSFVYRHLITQLSARYRCIAMDHLGFGLSDKPVGWSYRPADHARNVQALIEHLGLRDVTLIVHDFGGPIGLSYAVEQPENVRALVLFNTFMWPLRDDFAAPPIAKLMGGSFGRWLYTRFNISAKRFLPLLYGDRSKLTPAIHQQYLAPFPQPQDRYGMWAFARELLASADWYEQLWQQRNRIADKPTLLLWGMKDRAFGATYLERWQTVFANVQTVKNANVGHFVQEEEAQAASEQIASFLEPLV